MSIEGNHFTLLSVDEDNNTNDSNSNNNNHHHNVIIDNSTAPTDTKPGENDSDSHKNAEDLSFHYKHILYDMFRKLIWMPPFIAALLIPSMVVGLYCWAILNRQVDPFLPYISEVGTLNPQAAFFSQFLDCFAMLGALTFFLNYKKYKHQINLIGYQKANFIRILHGINWLSLGSGFAHCGLVIFIGNFRAREWQAVHLLAAICGFFTFCVYAVGTTYVLTHIHRSGQESSPTTMKVSIGLMILSMMGAFSTLLISFWVVGKDVYDPNLGLQWNSNNLGDTIHDISAIFQWIIFNSISLYLLCLSRRMYHFKSWDKLKFTQ